MSARRGARRGQSRRTRQTPSSFIARSCDGLATPLPMSGAGARGSKRVTGACGLLSLLSRLARSYSQARPSHLRAAVASLRSSADSAGPIRCRSRGSTVWPSELRAKLVAFSGDVDTSALAVLSRNSSSVMRSPTAYLPIPAEETTAARGRQAKFAALSRTFRLSCTTDGEEIATPLIPRASPLFRRSLIFAVPMPRNFTDRNKCPFNICNAVTALDAVGRDAGGSAQPKEYRGASHRHLIE
jgi:hypothetical protein